MGEKLTSLAKDSWSRNLPFEPERGDILDRNGVELATNKSAPSILVVPRQIKDPAETSKKLAAVLNMSEEKAYKHVTKKHQLNEFLLRAERYLMKKQKK